MEAPSGTSERRRGVGRGQKMRAAVLAATLAELAETGYAALTVEKVAQRAGVHKTTVYRHWRDRERLVVEALAEQVAQEIPMPNTGAIATDLREMARRLARWVTSQSGQAMLAAFLSDAATIPEIAQARRLVFEDRLRRAEPVVARAIARDELPAETDPTEVIKAMAAPIYFRLLISGDPIDNNVADRAAEVALTAAQAGLLSSGAGGS